MPPTHWFLYDLGQALHVVLSNVCNKWIGSKNKSMLMLTRCCRKLFLNYSKKHLAEDSLVPPPWEKREKNNVILIPGSVFCILFVDAAARGAICVFTLKIVKALIKNNLSRRWTFDLDIASTHGWPAWCWARPTNVDDSLEDSRWIRGLTGREVVRGVPRSSPKPVLFFCFFFFPSERDR